MIKDNYKKYDNAISVVVFFIKRILQCNLGMDTIVVGFTCNNVYRTC